MPSTPPSSPKPSSPISSNIPDITKFTLNETIIGGGVTIVNQQGTSSNNTGVTHTTFETTDSNAVVDVDQNLVGLVTFYDNTTANSEKSIILGEIADYASKIKCSDFQGKGTIEDYSVLFEAASKIATDAKQMTLDIDIAGFNEFGAAADELSKLFTSFTLKLQSISVIDDIIFLRSISSALAKIWNLSEVFGKFKKTILATSTLDVPKSVHDTKLLVEAMMNEINCSMTFINNFVTPSSNAPVSAQLSTSDKAIIDKAVSTIDNWSILCDQGITIAMSNNSDIQYLKQASEDLKSKATLLGNNTSILRAKLAAYNLS